MSEAGSDSGGISSHDGSKNDSDNTEPSNHISNFFILESKKVVAIHYSRDSNCKAYNYHEVAGDNF